MPFPSGGMTHDEVMQWMGVLLFACLLIVCIGWAVTGYALEQENKELRDRLSKLLALREKPDGKT